jgi:hypothetical protein
MRKQNKHSSLLALLAHLEASLSIQLRAHLFCDKNPRATILSCSSVNAYPSVAP